MSEVLRLDRFLSECGTGSRKQAVSIIKSGRVKVNGVTVTEPGLKIDTSVSVTLDKKELKYSKYAYYMLNKPAGCVSAVKDQVSDTVLSYLKGVTAKGLFPVGRLDKDTEGLLLITNDGDLCHKLTSPRKHVEKTYYVITDKRLPRGGKAKLEEGIDIGDETRCLPARVKSKGGLEGNEFAYELTITEGRFHQVKRMFLALGCKVVFLKRISEGGVKLDKKLEPGDFRPLKEEELKALKEE
ncbi:MAG: rRNA pseudouridine synthase [Lachnospiraceae bacterium]|nr:rRNA pseudouridine synthase [Lachnospiraceae bacterium]